MFVRTINMEKIVMVEQKLEELITFLQPYLPLANSHMVDFLTRNLWSKYVDAEIQNDIKTNGIQECFEVFWNPEQSVIENKYPSLVQFLDSASKNTLSSFKECIDVKKLQTILKSRGGYNVNKIRIEQFMSEKKSHEVEIMAETGALLTIVGNTSHIIDIGDGKGYLSSLLALHYKFKVLGVDASQTNTLGAIKRAKKLQKHWNDLMKNKGYQEESGKLSYKQATEFVTSNTDFEKLIRNEYPDEDYTKLSLIGLHTCGNLAPTSLRIFKSNPNFRTLCNVGCCYHSLSENVSEDSGFPMSNYLQTKNFYLGRNARMVASQSVDRIRDGNIVADKVLFYRALLQVLLERTYGPGMPKMIIGKIKKHADFNDYVYKALRKINLKIPYSDCEIKNTYLEHLESEKYLQAYHLIRASLAPIIESVILLDRLLFLRESGYKNSYLVKMFDPVVSPRCYSIVAIKD